MHRYTGLTFQEVKYDPPTLICSQAVAKILPPLLSMLWSPTRQIMRRPGCALVQPDIPSEGAQISRRNGAAVAHKVPALLIGDVNGSAAEDTALFGLRAPDIAQEFMQCRDVL